MQDSTGYTRRVQESPRENRRAQESAEESRRAQENPTEHSVARCALPRISSNLRFRIASLPHCFEHNFQSDRRKPRQQRSPPPQPNRTLPAPGQLDNGKHGKTWQSQALHRVAFFDPPYGAKLGQKTCFFFKPPFWGPDF